MLKAKQGPRIALTCGDLDLEIAPQLGGAVTALRWRGQDVLRPAGNGARHAIETACFPLAPYANRIALGRFSFAGRQVQLERNRLDQRHPLHGSAWLAPWRLEEVSETRAVVSCAFEPSDWPWRFSCLQEISVDNEGARLALTVRNNADAPMPLSFGYHPFFRRLPAGVLRTNVRGVWRADADLLPTRFDAVTDLPELGAGVALEAKPFVDHCHAGWDGEVVLSSPQMNVRMTASADFGFLHLYTPPGETYFCAEPVSAIPNAVNQSDPPAVGLRVLAPGESASGWMRIAAAPGSGR
jgi:aldose 1-epimerase